MFLTASSFSLMRWYATRHAKLFKPEYRALANASLRRSLLGPALYFAAMVAAQVSVPVSVALQLAVPVLFFLPARAPRAEDAQ